MKLKLSAVALILVMLGGRAFAASEWTDWSPIQGHSGERNDQVEGRSILDESSLAAGSGSGYRFYYELRNLSTTETAQVTLHFPASNATAAHELRPGGTATGSGLSPNPTKLDFESQIKWEESKAPKDAETPGTPEPAPEAGSPGAAADERNKHDPVLGIPLANNDALAEALEADLTHQYTAVISFVKQDNYDGVNATMEKFIDDMKSWCEECHARYGWLMKVIATDNRQVSVLFGPCSGPDMARFVGNSPMGKRVVLKLTRLGANGNDETVDASGEEPVKPAAPSFQGNGPLPSEPPAEKAQPWKQSALPAATPKAAASAPTPTTQASAAPTGAHHEGYWFDPDDEAADDPDPMIYVRLGGAATRVRLSLAKSENGVPADATPENMTVYSEKLKKIITNRHTQKRR